MSRSLTPYEGPNFHPGDTVCWSSSAGGFTKSKQGTVVALVPAGTYAMDAPQIRDFKNIGSSFGYGMPRRQDSYLVKVGKKLYWPRTEALRPVLTPRQEEFLLTYADEFDEAALPRKRAMSSEERKKARRAFVKKSGRLGIDGPATSAEIRIAQHFERIGLLKNVTPHGDPGARYLDVEFTAYGTLILFEVATQDTEYQDAAASDQNPIIG